MLICKFASPRSSKEKIHDWIAYLEDLNRREADAEARRIVNELLDEARCWTSSGGWIWKEARRLLFLGLLLCPPDDHLPPAAWVLFDPNRK